jgi:hypothetical protein
MYSDCLMHTLRVDWTGSCKNGQMTPYTGENKQELCVW